MKTDFETLRSLAAYVINYLKDAGYIDFNPGIRLELVDALATEMAVGLSTDEDIKEQAIEEVEDKMGNSNLPEDITETEMFNHARKEIIKSFNGENIGGLYLVESVLQLADRITKFIMESNYIEDVYGMDDEIITFLVDKIRTFSPVRA
jgi:hypothetical protein